MILRNEQATWSQCQKKTVMFTATICLEIMKPFDEKPRKETCSEIVKGYICICICIYVHIYI